jgi:hypothetical protein
MNNRKKSVLCVGTLVRHPYMVTFFKNSEEAATSPSSSISGILLIFISRLTIAIVEPGTEFVCSRYTSLLNEFLNSFVHLRPFELILYKNSFGLYLFKKQL